MACEKAVGATQAVLQNTMVYYDHKRRCSGGGVDVHADPKAHFKCAELKIIQSKADIENPPIVFRAEAIPW